MRTCPSCGEQSPDVQDFCTCGEYLRWELTGHQQAVIPEPAAATTPPAPARTMVYGAVPPPGAAAAAQPSPGEPATIVLRAPEGDPALGQTPQHAVDPGERERVLALVRNQSGIVDNYDLRIEGMPQDWYSIFPATVYLVPFGSAGTYEQEVEIHLHPPRGPEAIARVWNLRVLADSRAQRKIAAFAPLDLTILPYIETMTTLRPQRKRGRKKADFDVTVVNQANAPVLVALDGEDPDGEMQFGFNRPPQEIPAGGSVVSGMRVRPPRQIWIGRGIDRRLEVKTVTGEEAAERAAEQPLGQEVLQLAPPPQRRRFFRRRRAPRVPGMFPPRVYKPQMYPPGATMGPGGVHVRMPMFRGPQVQGPQMGSVAGNAPQIGQDGLPRRRPQVPLSQLAPTQGVFRQRPWIALWMPLLLLLLLLVLLLLYKLFAPNDTVVPKVVGQSSVFAAEERLTEAQLKLDPNQQREIDDNVAPGTVLEQTPGPGADVPKGTMVAILIAVGSGKVQVPSIVAMMASDAEKALRAKGLTLGQSSPTKADPKAKISSQIPAADEVVTEGTPVMIFYKLDTPAPGPSATPRPQTPEANSRTPAMIPAVRTSTISDYAHVVAATGLVPRTRRIVSATPAGTLVGTIPPAGSPMKAGASLTLLISAGFPKIAFADGDDIRLIDGATGKPLAPIADGPLEEKDPTWASDGHQVAYIVARTPGGAGQVYIMDTEQPNAKPSPLTRRGVNYENLAWSPHGDVLAMDRRDGPQDSDLCLLVVARRAATPLCKPEPDFQIGLAIHWSPDGRSILAPANRFAGVATGIVRWHTRTPFSPDPNDWSAGRFVTDTSNPGKSVVDAAISPDGTQLALVTNFGSDSFQLWITTPTDFSLTLARPTALRACKVAWRPDSQEVAITDADRACSEGAGPLTRLNPRHPRHTTQLATAANDPTYQPDTAIGR